MASKLKVQELALQSPNGLVEKSVSMGNDGIVVLPSTTAIGNVSNTELSYLDGVTSAVQTQLNAKAPINSPAFTGTPTISGSGRVISDSASTGTDVYFIWSGTQAQYDAIGTKDANTLYFIS